PWNPYHGWIDAVFDDPKLQDVLSHRPIGQSIGEIETLVQRGTVGVFHVPFDPHTEHELMRAGTLRLKPTLEVSSAAVKGILDKVRTTVLDWCLDLEAKGVLGEHMTFSEKEKQTASAANYHVHFHGAVTTSQIQQGSIHSSQTISMEIDLGGVKTFVTELGKRVAELGLAPDSARQM